MSDPLRILLIEDSEDDATLLVREVRKCGREVETLRVETASAMQEALARQEWDLILSDYALPRFSGLNALELLTQGGYDIPFIVVSGAIGEETAVQLMRAGACDYVSKGKPARIVPIIQRELADAEIRRQRKHAEQALEKAIKEEAATRNRIVDIIKSVPDGLLVCDDQTRVVLMNHAAEELLGVRAAEALNQPIATVLAVSDLAGQLQEVTAPAAPSTWKFHLELPQAGTKYPRVIQARTSPMSDPDGRPSGTVTVLRDITRERELDRMKSEFISTAAHELNTPLTAIIGYVELLLKPAEFGAFLPDQQRNFLEEIHGKSLVLAKIVEELLDISRLDAGQELPLSKAPCDLPELLTGTLDHFQQRAPRHRFLLELPRNSEPRLLQLDRVKIAEVLENLLSNAVKYSPDGGTVRIYGKISGENFECTVEDEGPGMPSDQVGQVFEPFYRIDASDTAVRGLGLGLSLAKLIVEAHHGKIWLESAPGKGTRVSFTLPFTGCPPVVSHPQPTI